MADLDACRLGFGQRAPIRPAWASRDSAGRGRIRLALCRPRPRLKAGVAWYGRLAGPANDVTPQHPVDVAARISAPVLRLYGGRMPDSPGHHRNHAKALAPTRNPAKFTSIRMPHAFHADYRPSYRQDAARTVGSGCSPGLLQTGFMPPGAAGLARCCRGRRHGTAPGPDVPPCVRTSCGLPQAGSVDPPTRRKDKTLVHPGHPAYSGDAVE